MGRARATGLLTHYFRLLFQAAGKHWDNDNDAEIALIVDEIIQAVKDELKAEAEARADYEASGSYAEYKHRYGKGANHG